MLGLANLHMTQIRPKVLQKTATCQLNSSPKGLFLLYSCASQPLHQNWFSSVQLDWLMAGLDQGMTVHNLRTFEWHGVHAFCLTTPLWQILLAMIIISYSVLLLLVLDNNSFAGYLKWVLTSLANLWLPLIYLLVFLEVTTPTENDPLTRCQCTQGTGHLEIQKQMKTFPCLKDFLFQWQGIHSNRSTEISSSSTLLFPQFLCPSG